MLETTAGGPGAGPVPPQYEPGIASRLFEPLGVRDVFGQSTMTASQVHYINEGTATSGAAGVGEAGTSPSRRSTWPRSSSGAPRAWPVPAGRVHGGERLGIGHTRLRFAQSRSSSTGWWGGGCVLLCRRPAARTDPKGKHRWTSATQSRSLVNAWLLAREGKGQVLEDWAEPEAQQLAEAGWLERRTVDGNGDTAWFWTREAETTLDMNALRRDDPADLN